MLNPQAVRLIGRFLYKFYRTFVSPFLGATCRFYPTCSDYCRQAVGMHGLLRGGILSFYRLLKCHPWHRCDWHDPVPENITWRDLVPFGEKCSRYLESCIEWLSTIRYKRGK